LTEIFLFQLLKRPNASAQALKRDVAMADLAQPFVEGGGRADVS
jgi:hypothetical protein